MSSSLDSSHQRVFVVRHGERIDHVDSTYKPKALRPHDAPLTQKGENMGKKLGQYLVQERNLPLVPSSSETTISAPPQVMILTSPLERCIQTSCRLIEGLGLKEKNIPFKLLLEEGIVEGPIWVNKDLEYRTQDQLREGHHLPLWYDSRYYGSKYPDLYVRSESARGRESLCCSSVPCRPEGNPPMITEDIHTPMRCADAAAFLFGNVTGSTMSTGESLSDENTKLLAEVRQAKVVFMVGHGETTGRWGTFLGGKEVSDPYYTGCLELHRTHKKKLVGEGKEEEELNLELPLFHSTQEQVFHNNHLES